MGGGGGVGGVEFGLHALIMTPASHAVDIETLLVCLQAKQTFCWIAVFSEINNGVISSVPFSNRKTSTSLDKHAYYYISKERQKGSRAKSVPSERQEFMLVSCQEAAHCVHMVGSSTFLYRGHRQTWGKNLPWAEWSFGH